jgi:hypothetical protein
MPRWKELAAMVYCKSDAPLADEVLALFDQQRGAVSASRSWTGRGLKPAGYDPGPLNGEAS